MRVRAVEVDVTYLTPHPLSSVVLCPHRVVDNGEHRVFGVLLSREGEPAFFALTPEQAEDFIRGVMLVLGWDTLPERRHDGTRL